MTGAELKAWRERRGMGPAAFGRYLRTLMGRDRPYTATEVQAWERGYRRGVPAKVEAALLRVDMEERRAADRG